MKSSDEVINAMILLNHIQYDYGIIGINEYNERLETIDWLLDVEDEKQDDNNESSISDESFIESKKDPNIIHFIPSGLTKKWFFTKGDADPFPAVPHGHESNQNQKWNKLNPYTGQIYKNKTQIVNRLSKKEMSALWKNEKFRIFCFDHVSWYLNTYPHHSFPTSKPLRFPRK